MAWYPGAQKMELQPESDAQVAITPTQFILHSIAAPWTVRRVYEYWRDSTNLESHFGLGFDGSLAQYIGTQTRADANAGANGRAVSLESASNLNHTDPWTAEQLETIVNLGVWLHQHHGLPLRVCRSWDDPGYGFHRLFSQWSLGGTACPGDARVKQFYDYIFPEICRRAGGDVPTTPPKNVVDLSQLIGAAKSNPPLKGTPVTYSGVVLVEEALNKEGLLNDDYVDGHYGSTTIKAYSGWQKRLGYTGSDADGIPGNSSLTKLGNKYGFAVVA